MPPAGTLSLAGVGILDLNGNNATVTDVTSSVNTATITDTNATAGTSTFTVSNQATSINALVLDGANRAVAVRFANNNLGNNPIFALANQNTFSGGLTLLGSGGGTRLHINGPVTTTGGRGPSSADPLDAVRSRSARPRPTGPASSSPSTT